MNRLFISAAHKSSGKTTISIGLCRALVALGHVVQPFKKGPDYIDPIWLTAASGNACHNLDFNTMHDAEILQTLQHYGHTADISLIEANKGLYDGVALDGSDSNAAMAKLVDSPIVLVINAVGTTRGVAPLLLGYQIFDPDIQIAGVIYNLVGGKRHAQKLRQVTKTYTDIPVLGMVHKNPLMEIEERHLGLMPSNETQQAQQQIETIANLVKQQIDMQALITIAQSASSLAPVEREFSASVSNISLISTQTANPVFSSKLRIAVCQDPAFGFYYAGDLEALERAGAELVVVNTLMDSELPQVDALFIGGGFPETQMQALSENCSMRASIKTAIEAGLPTYAECGGLMYLAENLIWKDNSAAMVGIIPADVVMSKKPQGRGYIELSETEDMPWPHKPETGAIIHAHEFHYSRLKGLQEKGKFAYQVKRGQGINGQYDGWLYKNLLASYAHMRDTAKYRWAKRFVAFAIECRSKAHTSL
jgi:cobyrinic acid a,c-diamide synthase